MGILLRSTPPRAYGLALLTVLLASLLTLGAWPLIHELSLLFFFVAVLLSAWYGGLGPGLLATLVSTLVLAYFFLPPFSAGGARGSLSGVGFCEHHGRQKPGRVWQDRSVAAYWDIATHTSKPEGRDVLPTRSVSMDRGGH